MCEAKVQQVNGWQADCSTATGLIQVRLRAECDGMPHRGLCGISRGPTGSRDNRWKDGEKEQGKTASDAGSAKGFLAFAGDGGGHVVGVGGIAAAVLVDKGQFRLKSRRKF